MAYDKIRLFVEARTDSFAVVILPPVTSATPAPIATNLPLLDTPLPGHEVMALFVFSGALPLIHPAAL